MPAAAITLLVLVAAALIAAVIMLARRRPLRIEPGETKSDGRDWTTNAGAEFAHLSEADRCDLVFAVAALEGPRSQRLLEEALDDPSEAVALAAARAMTSRGRSAELERYLALPSERSRRIAAMLQLFT
jgi:hypothetical protein